MRGAVGGALRSEMTTSSSTTTLIPSSPAQRPRPEAAGAATTSVRRRRPACRSRAIGRALARPGVVARRGWSRSRRLRPERGSRLAARAFASSAALAGESGRRRRRLARRRHDEARPSPPSRRAPRRAPRSASSPTILSQPSAATRPFGVPSPVSWMRRIHCVSSSFVSPSERTSVPLQGAALGLDGVEEPARVEQVELVRRRQRLVDRLLGELAAAPERPHVGERDPAHERLGREPLLERLVVDVARDERVVHDLLHLLVVVAQRRLDAADAPGRDDGPAHLVGQIAEELVGARPSRRAGRTSRGAPATCAPGPPACAGAPRAPGRTWELLR